jgi:hypothetical protein
MHYRIHIAIKLAYNSRAFGDIKPLAVNFKASGVKVVSTIK